MATFLIESYRITNFENKQFPLETKKSFNTGFLFNIFFQSLKDACGKMMYIFVDIEVNVSLTTMPGKQDNVGSSPR